MKKRTKEILAWTASMAQITAVTSTTRPLGSF